MTPIAVTIAGSDSGGGAGIQADLKTFSALGVYGASVITALTAQNTRGVTGIHDVPPEFITAQIDAVFSDLKVGAVKIGMLSQRRGHRGGGRRPRPPPAGQCGARSGDGGEPPATGCCKPDAVDNLRRLLIPQGAGRSRQTCRRRRRCSTRRSPTDEAAMRAQARAAARARRQGGADQGRPRQRAGERRPSGRAPYASRGSPAERIVTRATRTAPAARCRRRSPRGSPRAWRSAEAVRAAKSYITEAIAAADRLEIGAGHGPVHHFHRWW